jgi:UPF0755 protein
MDDKDKEFFDELFNQNEEKFEIKIPEKNQESSPEITDFEDIESGEEEHVEEILEEEQQEEITVKTKRKKKSTMTTVLVAFIIVISSIIISFTALFVLNDVLALYKENVDITVNIPKGVSTDEIAKILKENKIINIPFAFRIVSKLNEADGTYQYGEYTLNPRMSYPTIISKLQKAASKRASVEVTLIEGTSIITMSRILEENEVCFARDFLDAANRENFGFDFEDEISNNSLKFQRVEGFIMPDTYEFYIGETPQNVVKKIFSNFNDKFTPDMRARMEELNMSLEELIKLASIVQNEAPVDSEMRKVAGVFFNRINDKKNFPRFESDTTNKYIREIITPHLEIANEKMILAYDTYKTPGYPPSAICNPGIEAIKATLYPEKSTYLYFCSNLETKQFFYANTLAEHSVNLRKAGLR